MSLPPRAGGGYGQQQFGQGPLGSQNPYTSAAAAAAAQPKGPAVGNGGDDDDLYGGFQGVDVNNLRTATGRGTQNPPAAGYATGAMLNPSSNNYDPNNNNNNNNNYSNTSRPMTAIRGAGYSLKASVVPGGGGVPGTAMGKGGLAGSIGGSIGGGSIGGGGASGVGGQGNAAPLLRKPEGTPEDLAREMEKVVNRLVEESAVAAVEGDKVKALKKAKEAASKERALCRHRESNGVGEQINIDLTYSVNFNLANQQHANGLHNEALKTYQLIVKNKQYAQAGRLRVNMGNIYFEEGRYPGAIKMYRMALDQVPVSATQLRYKIQRNIGNAFVRMGQYLDAIQSFEAIMEGTPDLQTGFNLLVCYFMLNDREKMKEVFNDLIATKVEISPDEGDVELLLSAEELHEDHVAAARRDELREILKQREARAHKFISTAGKLIAPVVERDMAGGFEYIIETLRTSNSSYEKVAAEMEIAKAVAYLRRKEYESAIEVLRAMEKKDTSLAAAAATNLAFTYFIRDDLQNAEKYANTAVDADRYSAPALVNLGACAFARGNHNAARELFASAVSVEADCFEAVYNLGLTYKKLGMPELAAQQFSKAQTILPEVPEVLWQLSSCHEMLGDSRQSYKWLSRLKSAGQHSDPDVLRSLAGHCENEGDETQAYGHYYDSYRFLPASMETIAWLGGYSVKNELYERGLEFFNRASLIEPKQPSWRLMAASCLRRIGQFQEAFAMYTEIHEQFPANVECLRYLVQLCKLNLGYTDKADMFAAKLAKLERSKAKIADIKSQMGGPGGHGNQHGASSGSSPSSSSPGPSSSSAAASSAHRGTGQSGGGLYDKPAAVERNAAIEEPDTHIGDDALASRGGKKIRAGQVDDESWGEGALDELLPGI